jgi:hypothetical protein
LGITIRDRQLFKIDITKKKQIMLQKLNLPAAAPSIAVSKNGEVFIEIFGAKIYYMKNIKSKPILLGKTGVCPWGIAIKSSCTSSKHPD